ncbi:uncharacterized protein LOC110446407 [Mizuhopecten yessoensis]|uniref:uncharacterized protein LOC110446407 n=1 Tax=Mizuhopecten yessoensis TaxID=6573 RepID=UPI000B458089|nr:uncharacterized protein LOC110446407 [Mizuhopecten yessoensis]XP_021347219.1 uncharacterized protein LOC110446407 [Mizuhopecten yessoensis]
MATENQENYYDWRHFLSSLGKKSKSYFTPEKQKKDVFLGNIDCFSTNLSRQLLGTSGQKIETELTPSSFKKLKTSAEGYDEKHDYYVHTVPGSRSEDAPGDAVTPSKVPKGKITPSSNTQVNKHGSNTTGNQTASKGLGVDKTDPGFSDKFEEGTQKARSHMDDVLDLVKVESDSSSEVLRKQSTKVIEPDMFENISDSVKVEANSISPEVLRKQTTKLLEPGTLEALSVEAQVEEKCDSEVSENKSKVAQEAMFSSVQRPGEKAASSSHPDKTYKLEANGKKGDFVKCLYQKACPKKAKVPTILAAAEISEIKENIETNRVRQRYTNKNKRKADVDTPCSQWTLEMLSKYVDFKQSVGEIEEKKELEGFQNIIDRTVRQTLSQIETVQQVIFAPHKSSIGHRQPETGSGDIYNLSDIRGTEADV